MKPELELSKATLSELETRIYSPIEELEKICVEFQARLYQNENPQLETYLDRVATSERRTLLGKLIKIEFEHARDCGSSDFSIYFDRFPESRDVLRSVQSELADARIDLGVTRHANQLPNDTVIDSPSILPQLERFQLIKRVGVGGFGTVWQAIDMKLKRQVAVKLVNQGPAASHNLASIMNEAQTNAKLDHPNIVQVFDVDEATSAIVTHYIEGCNLKIWRGDRIVEPVPAAQLVVKLAKAVHYAHTNGVIHRDLKPSNILMDLAGEPHIVDFGLAKHELGIDALALPGKVMGTLEYMAPEQARADHKAVERRSDIYSLGVILFELLTGRLPFRGEEALLLSQVIHNRPPHPRSINPAIPVDLAEICLKCLRKSPADRYAQAKDLQNDLERYLEGEVIKGVDRPWHEHVWKWTRKHYQRAQHLWVGLIAGVGVISTLWWASLPAPFRQQVVFETEPAGCTITAVEVDPATGEPDPEKIHVLPGRTPLKAKLPPGDYFVVAVLNSAGGQQDVHFHEVFRYIPDADEGIPFVRNHTRWKKDQSGRILLPKINIPTSSTSDGMAYIEESVVDRPTLVFSRVSKAEPDPVRVPAFYADLSEVTIQDAQQVGIKELKVSAVEPFIQARYDDATAFAERVGKRLPFAAELVALETASDSEVLFGNSKISGIHSQLWEWTASRPSGTAARPLRRSSLGDLNARTRIIRNGPPTRGSKGDSLSKVQVEHRVDPEIGFRTVRSVKPPQTASDFMALRKRTPTPAK